MCMQMAEVSPSRVLRKEQIEKLAVCGNRYELVKEMLRHVPKGTRRIADVEKVGPANVDKCTMAVEEWDKVVNSRERMDSVKEYFLHHLVERIVSEDVKKQSRRMKQYALYANA